MTTQDLINYYAGLLIIQYIGRPRAYAHMQALVTPVIMPQTTTESISFSAVPASGTFTLSYGGVASAAINWNDSAATIQTKLQAISGLGSVTVSGTISTALLVTFTGVTPPALLLVPASSLLDSNGNAITITVAETDLMLALAVQAAFNLTVAPFATGVQLDTLGKYAGIVRTGYGPSGPITLNDSDFLTLIKLAILKNSAGSSLSEIQSLLNMFFPGEVLVFDYANMQMSYLVSTTVGSLNLVILAITNGLLPKPMAVALALVIYGPNITQFFGFRTYSLPAFNVEPFNNYTSYQTTWPWISYQNAVVA